MASSSTDSLVKLKSPFNGEIVAMEFGEGTTPTLDAMLQAGFVRVDDKGKPIKDAKA